MSDPPLSDIDFKNIMAWAEQPSKSDFRRPELSPLTKNFDLGDSSGMWVYDRCITISSVCHQHQLLLTWPLMASVLQAFDGQKLKSFDLSSIRF